MNLLINTPDYRNPSSGGVASYYYGMLGYWTERVRYNVVGRRKGLSGALWLPWDVVKFTTKMLLWQPDAVMVNPSLFRNAMRRDFVFLSIARSLRVPVVVLIHGFDLGVAGTIDRRWVSIHLNRASLVMVLADRFREILKSWGVTTPIELMTTKVEDRMLEGFNIESRDGRVNNILFLSRMVREKGVYETIDTFALLRAKHPELRLTMVGGGKELYNLKRYAENCGVDGVTFTGPLDGEARLRAYRNANFFFFSSYGEGMPTVVLEAMAFGMPVVTRTVGGIVDFFEDGKMGRITDSLDSTELAALVEPFLEDAVLTQRVSVYNYEYAKEHFMASKVGRRIETLIRGVIG